MKELPTYTQKEIEELKKQYPNFGKIRKDISFSLFPQEEIKEPVIQPRQLHF